MKPSGIDAQDLGVAVVGGAHRQAEAALEVELPARDAVGVLADEFALPGGDRDLVDVVPRGVAVVEADVDGVRGLLRDVVDEGPCSLRVGEVPRRRDVLALRLGRGGVDGPDVEVLVAVLVLDVEEETAVARPEEAGDRPLRLGGHEPRRFVGLAGLLDVDVARVLPGPQEGEVLAVGRDLGAGDLGVAEEQLAVEERRRRRGGRSGHEAEGERQAREEGGSNESTMGSRPPSKKGMRRGANCSSD